MVAFYILIGIFSFLLLLFLLWLVFLTCTSKYEDTKTFSQTLYAHRGFYNKEAGIEENSLPAFQRALDRGFGMEFDLHLTKDEKLIVMHDSSLKRTCNVDLSIPENTLSELRNYPLNDGTVIPTFEEVLSLVKGKAPLIIELKNDGNNGKKLVSKTLAELKNYPGPYCIESFDPRIVRQVKKQAPHVFRGQLSSDFFKSNQPFYYKPLLTSMITNVLTKPQFIAYHVTDARCFPFRVLKRTHIPVFFWTVHGEEEAKKLLKEGYIPIFEEK